MILTAMLGIISGAETAPESSIEVSHANVQFANTIYLLVAVNYGDYENVGDIKLQITNTVSGSVDVISRSKSTEATEGFPEGCIGFKYTGLTPKNLGDELILQAYVDGAAVGEAKGYSILEYSIKAEEQNNAKLTSLVKAMINYGEKAQIAFDWKDKATYDLAVDYSIIKLVGGAAFEDGATKKIFKDGDKVVASKAGAAETDIWYNQAMQRLGVGASIEISHSKENQTVFVAPASTASEFYLDMDKYEGDSLTVENGTKVTVNGFELGDVINEGGSTKVENGYLYITNSAGISSVSSIGASQFCSVMASVMASESKVFTLSVTVSTSLNSAGVMNLYLRGGSDDVFYTDSELTNAGSDSTIAFGNKYYDAEGNVIEKATTGRLYLISSEGNKMLDYYSEDGASAKTTATTLAEIPTWNSKSDGGYVTIHIVFDLENYTMTYYVNDSKTAIFSCAIPVALDYFENSVIEHYAETKEVSYLKALVISYGDVTEYFE